MTTIDPKFADLPWIAFDQPDVYESGCAQPVEQSNKSSSHHDIVSLNPEIESESFPVAKAFDAFKNAYLDGSNADFSESSASKSVKGYRAVLYDLAARDQRESETIAQRFDRIQLEINQLIQDATAVSETKENDNSSEKTNDLKDKAEQFCQYLENSFKNLNVDSVKTKPRSILSDAVARNFEELKKTFENSSEGDKEIVMSLLHSVKNEKTYESERIIELEKKIQRLETLVGNEDLTKFSALTCGNVNASLYEIANRLEAKSNLLDPKNLTQIESRLGSFNTVLQSITEKREKITEADTIKKIGELYEIVKKWSATYDSIPMIVDHLVSLRAIHSDTAEFSKSLNLLEEDQTSLQKKLADVTQFFQVFQPQFEKQTNLINENIEKLTSKLD